MATGEHQVNAGERRRLRGAEAPVRSEAPEMGDLTYDRPQPWTTPRRTKPGEEVPRDGAYPHPVPAALDLASLQLVLQQSGSVDVGRITLHFALYCEQQMFWFFDFFFSPYFILEHTLLKSMPARAVLKKT